MSLEDDSIGLPDKDYVRQLLTYWGLVCLIEQF
jgi:hypothetical protein